MLRDVDGKPADSRRHAVGAGNREANAGKVSGPSRRGHRVGLALDALAVEDAPITCDEACCDLGWKHLRVGTTDRGLVLDAEDAEAVRASVEVPVVTILHVEDRRDVLEDRPELGALADQRCLELRDACAQANELLVVVRQEATPSSSRWSKRSIRSIEERLPIRWAWSIAAKRWVCSIMRRPGFASSSAM